MLRPLLASFVALALLRWCVPHRSPPTTAVVWVAQPGRHSSYGSDSWTSLKQSVASWRAYGVAGPDLVVVSGDPFSKEQRAALDGIAGQSVVFALEDWSTPMPYSGWAHYPIFSAGYRKMIHFWALDVWPWAEARGYTRIMRMDDDSILTSRMVDDPFQRTEPYICRMATRDLFEGRHVRDRSWRLKTARVLHGLGVNLTSSKWFDSRVDCYQNWFVADVALGRNTGFIHFVRAFEEEIWRDRTNDLVLHSVAATFARGVGIAWARDFGYMHVTVTARKCAAFGGIVRGTRQSNESWRAALVAYRLRTLCGMHPSTVDFWVKNHEMYTVHGTRKGSFAILNEWGHT